MAEGALAVGWLIAIGTSFGLWWLFLDASALPAAGSWADEALASLGRVPYAEPDVIARVRATRIAILATFGALAVLGAIEHRRVARAVRRFFTTPTHPLNLAVFRIVLFLQAYNLAYFDFVARIAALPDGLQLPPPTGLPGLGPLSAVAVWPLHALSASQVLLVGQAMTVACITAMLGLFSRTSALVVAATVLYGWGTIQWYGKVDHNHHVFWFALVLAASRCGDSLSIDSLVRAWRDGRSGRTEPPAAGLAYGVPMRFCMLLMGVLYFFPGFWKIWRSGFDWFLGDSPYHQIWMKWHMIGGWLPGFRIDEHPLLVHGGAFGTILFELSFVFLIFGRRTIYAAAAMGFAFHTSLDLLMRHGFHSLRNCYVIFVDWHRLVGWLGRGLSLDAIAVSFDARERRTASLVACLRTFDWLGRIRWVDESVERRQPDERTRPWQHAQRAIAARVPLLWPLLPLLYLRTLWRPAAPPASSDRALSVSPASDDDAPPRGKLAPVDLATPRASRKSARGLVDVSAARRRAFVAPILAPIVVGSLLVVLNAGAGARRLQDAWPIACYPLFDGLLSDSYTTLQIDVLAADGIRRTIVPDDYRHTFGNRWSNVLQRILRDDDEARRRERLRVVWDVLSREDAQLGASRRIRFSTVRSWIRPEQWRRPPEDPELIYEVVL